jgi:hypothetical protein
VNVKRIFNENKKIFVVVGVLRFDSKGNDLLQVVIYLSAL